MGNWIQVLNLNSEFISEATWKIMMLEFFRHDNALTTFSVPRRRCVITYHEHSIELLSIKDIIKSKYLE